MRVDKRRLVRALREVGASGWHWRAAGILLAVNGIRNALEYVYGLQERGLTERSYQPMLPLEEGSSED